MKLQEKADATSTTHASGCSDTRSLQKDVNLGKAPVAQPTATEVEEEWPTKPTDLEFGDAVSVSALASLVTEGAVLWYSCRSGRVTSDEQGGVAGHDNQMAGPIVQLAHVRQQC